MMTTMMGFHHIQGSWAELAKHSLIFRCNISWDIDADYNDGGDDDNDDVDNDDDET